MVNPSNLAMSPRSSRCLKVGTPGPAMVDGQFAFGLLLWSFSDMWPKSQIWVIKHKTNNTHNNTDNTIVDDLLWALLPVPALRLENEVTLFGMHGGARSLGTDRGDPLEKETVQTIRLFYYV
jgi:hypothetical protein